MSSAQGPEPAANSNNIDVVRSYVQKDIKRFQRALGEPKYAEQAEQFRKSLSQSKRLLAELSAIEIELDNTRGDLSAAKRKLYGKIVAFVSKAHPNLQAKLSAEPWRLRESGDLGELAGEPAGAPEGAAERAAEGPASAPAPAPAPAPGVPAGPLGARPADAPLRSTLASLAGLDEGQASLTVTPAPGPALPGPPGPGAQPAPPLAAAPAAAPAAPPAAPPSAPPAHPDPQIIADLSSALAAASAAREGAEAAAREAAGRADDLSARLDAALRENASLTAELASARQAAAQAQTSARNFQLMYLSAVQERDVAVQELLEARERLDAGEHAREVSLQVEQLTAMVQESYRNGLVEMSEDLSRKISSSLAQYEEIFRKLKRQPRRSGTVSSVSPRSVLASGVSDLGASAFADDGGRGPGLAESSFVGEEPLPAPEPQPSVRSASTGRQALGRSAAPPTPGARPGGASGVAPGGPGSRNADALVAEVVRIITGLGTRAPALQRISQREWSVERNGRVLRLGFGEDGVVVVENEGMVPLEGYLRAMVASARPRQAGGRSRSGSASARGGLASSRSFSGRAELGSSQGARLNRSAMSTVSQGSYVSQASARRGAPPGRGYAAPPGRISVSSVSGLGEGGYPQPARPAPVSAPAPAPGAYGAYGSQGASRPGKAAYGGYAGYSREPGY